MARDQVVTVELEHWPRRRAQLDELLDAEATARGLAKNAGALLVKELGRASPRARPHRGSDKPFADSWSADVGGWFRGARLTVRNEAPQAPFVLFPTKAHGPKRAKALRWETPGGEIVFRKRVKGTKGNPVLDRVWGRMGGPLEDVLRESGLRVRAALLDIWT